MARLSPRSELHDLAKTWAATLRSNLGRNRSKNAASHSSPINDRAHFLADRNHVGRYLQGLRRRGFRSVCHEPKNKVNPRSALDAIVEIRDYRLARV
jgi:hypothetical protein